MWYNMNAETKGASGRFAFAPSAIIDIVGKAPSVCGLHVPPFVSATMATHGGRFAMANKLCECGCGETPKSGNRFVNGHNTRLRSIDYEHMLAMTAKSKLLTPWNKGRKLGPRPLGVRRRISETQRGSLRGPRSEADRCKISTGLIGHTCDEETRRKISDANRGHEHSDEARRKMSVAHTGKRLSDEHRKKIGRLREEHWNWKGGVGDQGYSSDWILVKRAVRKRDDYQCLECNANTFGFFVRPDVHHIDADKLNNEWSNLICLCRSCHIRAQFRLAESSPRFRAILAERYGYVYD